MWRETGILEKFPKGGPKERWHMPIGGGYSGPAVADGRVYVSDRVLAKGARTRTTFRTRPALAAKNAFGASTRPDGKVLWKKSYPCTYQISYAAGPRATPTVGGGKVYLLGAMGDLHCYDAETGDDVWSKNFVKDKAYNAPVPMWGFAALRCSTATSLFVSSAAMAAWSSPSTRTPAPRNGGSCRWKPGKSATVRQ